MKTFAREALLIGMESLQKLQESRVAVFGVGGVGGYVVEALSRAGVGHLVLVDSDRVAESNINRQILALHSTIGREKVEVARERILDIQPGCEVETHCVFFGPDTVEMFDFSSYDYVVDAIDTVTGKLLLVEKAREASTPVISCMGAGNKLDPTAFEVADIYQTSVCPLAKVMRRELKKRGIDHLKVVYSKEIPLRPRRDLLPEEWQEKDLVRACEAGEALKLSQEAQGESLEEREPKSSRRETPGSLSFVPSVAGLILAGEVIKDLIR